MSRKRKLFLTTAVVALVSGLTVMGTFAAFSATTVNEDNKITSGTVIITDSDENPGVGALSKLAYYVGDQTEGAKTAKCIRVSYTGSLTAAAVKLYLSDDVAVGSDGKYTLQIERGSGLTGPMDEDMDCTGFTSSSTPFNADLDTLPTTYATGIDGKAAAATWATNDTVDYRFTITIKPGVVNGNLTDNDTGDFDFTWEAQSA